MEPTHVGLLPRVIGGRAPAPANGGLGCRIRTINGEVGAGLLSSCEREFAHAPPVGKIGADSHRLLP